MDSADDIIRAIEAAFAGVPCGQVTLHEAEVMDAYGSEVERRAARRFDPDDDWTKVSAACEHEDQCDATVAKQALDAHWSSVP